MSKFLIVCTCISMSAMLNAQTTPSTTTNAPEVVSNQEAKPSKTSKKKKKKATPAELKAKQDQEIFSAVQEGDAKTLEVLVKANKVDYYGYNEAGETALTAAIQNNDVVKAGILAKKAVINQRNKAGETPLTLAIKKNNPELVQIVLERARPALKNATTESPLYLAIGNNDVNLVRNLLEKGANPNAKTKGMTPLSYATLQNSQAIAALLLKSGAKTNLANDDNSIPLALAVKMDFDLIAGMLLAKSETASLDANWKTKFGEPLINLVAKKGNPTLLKMLVESGASLSSVDAHDNTPLHIAAMNGKEKAVAYILEQNGADLNAQNMRGATPLVMAALNGKENTYQMLLRKGVDANMADYSGMAAAEYLAEAKGRASIEASENEEGLAQIMASIESQAKPENE